MNDLQKTDWKEIEGEIFRAYRNVKLGNGIGYYEAGAIEDFLKPADLEYIEEKNKDERDDWTKLLKEFDDRDLAYARHCFMDSKGLHFYLPFLMIRRDDIINSILHAYISDYYKTEKHTKSIYIKTVSLMTEEQKHCIFIFYNFLSKVEHSDFWGSYLNMEYDDIEQEMEGLNFMSFIKEKFYQK